MKSSLFSLALLLFSPLLLAEELPEKGSKEICAQRTQALTQLESKRSNAHNALRIIEMDLKEQRDLMDKTTKILTDAEMGKVSKEKEDQIQRGRDKPFSKEMVIATVKKWAEYSLDIVVKRVDKHKQEQQAAEIEINDLSREIAQERANLAGLGCTVPPEQTLALPTPEKAPTKESETAPQPTGSYRPFLGKWSGTAKVTKSSEPKYLGLSSPYTLSISAKENKLELMDSTGIMGKPAAYKIKSEGSTLQVDYSGPSNLEVPQVTTILNFTLRLALAGNKLTGTVSTNTKSDYEGPAGSGSATVIMDMVINLVKAP